MTPEHVALAKCLGTIEKGSVQMRFADFEAITGTLPASARRWRTWWANTEPKPQAVAWIAASREVIEVTILEDWVVFSALAGRP